MSQIRMQSQVGFGRDELTYQMDANMQAEIKQVTINREPFSSKRTAVWCDVELTQWVSVVAGPNWFSKGNFPVARAVSGQNHFLLKQQRGYRVMPPQHPPPTPTPIASRPQPLRSFLNEMCHLMKNGDEMGFVWVLGLFLTTLLDVQYKYIKYILC